MLVKDLLNSETRLAPGSAPGQESVRVKGLTADSRKVEPGFLFAAIPGTARDGAEFVPQALEKGATAILTAEGAKLPSGTGAPAHLVSANPRRALALAAARFYGRQPDTVVAVTGTNGKTSIASFVRQMWEGDLSPAASLGTLGVVTPEGTRSLGLTTPDPVDIHAALAEVKDMGIERLALEASSHGLAQYRLDGVRIKAAAFTNLSRDHMDYHESYEDYFAAKLRLFTELVDADGVAVLNADAEITPRVAEAVKARGLRILSVGTKGDFIHILEQTPSVNGQNLLVECEGMRYPIFMPLMGAFQAMNALQAAALVVASGVAGDAYEVLPLIESLKGAPGRMELIARSRRGAPVIVDYAHTPDALASVLQSVRPHTGARLHVVFGCGGDRDKGKRPEMGRIACQFADRVIVTDDNPRNEDAGIIRKEIMAACPGALEIGDRGEAIAEAVSGLGEGDLLVVAGKGHETGQIIKETVVPFSDTEVVKGVIASMERV